MQLQMVMGRLIAQWIRIRVLLAWTVAQAPLCAQSRLRKNRQSSGGRVMKCLRTAGLALGVLVLPLTLSTMATAADVSAGGAPAAAGARMWLACENGREYPLRPIGVSREYDLVTGYMLMTGHGRGVHMRLIPMGSGYRYAGRGVWFDGLRGDAVLNWGTSAAVPCKVMHG